VTNGEPRADQSKDPFEVEPDRGSMGPPAVELTDWIELVVNAVRRRWLVFVSVVLVVLAASVAYYRFKGPVYRVEAKILAQRQPSILSVGRSGGDDLPARSAWEIIHRRDNLVSLVQQNGLLGSEFMERGPWVGARLLALIRPPGTEGKEEPIDLLVRELDKRLLVTVEEGTILLQFDWPDARQAYGVVQAALEGFLEARHVQEVTAIDDVIAKLEGRTAKMKADLDAAVEAARRRGPSAVRATVPRERQPSEDLVRLRSLVEAKARAVRDVEEFRSRRLAELESQLAQSRTTLSDAHPTVSALRGDIDALSRDSAQLRALKEEERALRAQYTAQLGREGLGGGTTGQSEPVIIETGGAREEDPRVRDLRLQYEQMASRLTAAHVDLDAARAAFKYRYNVIWPPEIPSEPRSPDPRKVFGIGLIVALLAGFLAAALPDVLSGRVVERWQVERDLDLTVLAEMDRGGRPGR
jgi:uncharacterized protein involved in exopolysaccharide biosynthesis